MGTVEEKKKGGTTLRGEPGPEPPGQVLDHGPENSRLETLAAVVKDSFSLVMEARKGIPATLAFDIAHALQIHIDQLAEILHTTTKTLRNYRQHRQKLNPAHSEQLLKLLALLVNGNKVFGEPAPFRRWLEKPAYGLDDQIPIDLLKTSGGIDLVMEELDRIAYGDLA